MSGGDIKDSVSPNGWMNSELMHTEKMNDTRFKWIVGCCTFAVVAIVGMFLFAPGKSRNEIYGHSRLGEYVYLDLAHIIHVNRKCPKLNYKRWRSERIKVNDLVTSEEMSFCPKCVSDEDYETLNQAAKDNKFNRSTDYDALDVDTLP